MEDTSASSSSPVSILAGNPVLRVVGSLWFAALLLILLVVGMACATVYESLHGTDEALAVFYTARWFEAILALIAVNALTSVITRYPFSKRQIGFVLTHLGLLVTLGGAVVTAQFGINGQIGIFEGDTADTFNSTGVTTLIVESQRDRKQASVDLTARAFAGFQAVDHPDAPALDLDDLRIEVERFIPDSEWTKHVVDDAPDIQPAVEISFSASGRDDPAWLFGGHKPDTSGAAKAVFRTATTKDELDSLLAVSPKNQPASSGLVKVEYGGSTYEIPLQEALDHAVPIGDTKTTIRVLRYIPHASVGADNQVVSLSNHPTNPAIEAEIVGPEGDSEKRLAFAKFPDFQSMHGKKQVEGLKLTFVAPSKTERPALLEIISAPTGELYARFNLSDEAPDVRKLEIGVPVESPRPGKKFTVLRRFEHARVDWNLEPVNPARTERKPALLLKLTTPQGTDQAWVQKYVPRSVTVGGGVYDLSYGNKQIPLGFKLTLDRFHLERYPGTMRPRSFESHITITDPVTQQSRSRVISMNAPMKYGGYSLYQSSYRQSATRSASFLSVSWDPGQPIIFTGYILMLLGMVVVLGQRLSRVGRVPPNSVEESDEAQSQISNSQSKGEVT